MFALRFHGAFDEKAFEQSWKNVFVVSDALKPDARRTSEKERRRIKVGLGLVKYFPCSWRKSKWDCASMVETRDQSAGPFDK